MSGLQPSARPKKLGNDSFEQDTPDINYAYFGIPMPPIAGGQFDIARVFATEVRWETNQWTVVNARFDAAGSMHAANEFIGFRDGEVNGFPIVNGPAQDGRVVGRLVPNRI